MFKNIIVRTINTEITLTELETALKSKIIQEPIAEQRNTFGFSNIPQTQTQVMLAQGRFALFCFNKRARELPAWVVQKEANKRIESIQENEGRKLSYLEKRTIKGQIEAEMLPKAPIKEKTTLCFFDLQKMMLFLNASTNNEAELITSILRSALGSLPAMPLPKLNLTRWFENPPENIQITNSLYLKTPDGEKITFTNSELDQQREDIKAAAYGAIVEKMGFQYGDHFTAKINNDSIITTLKPTDTYKNKVNETEPESAAEELDIAFNLLTLTLEPFAQLLLEETEGAK